MSEYRLLRQALDENIVDQATLEAKAVLAERIGNLKSSSSIFAGISFSPDVANIETNARIAVA